MRTVKNKYKVNKNRWRKWSVLARQVFNETYYILYNNRKLFLHPKADVPTRSHWRTTAWNAAWTAADSANGEIESANGIQSSPN